MRLTSALIVLIAALATPLQTMACMGDQKPQLRQHVRYYPIAGDKTSHWPSEIRAVIGSYTSFMVPVDTSIELIQRQNDPFSPLTLLDEARAKYVYTSSYLVPSWVNIEYDAKKFKWVHLGASGYGVSEVRMHSPGGWSKTVNFTLIYPSATDEPVKPVVQVTPAEGEEKTVRVDGYDSFEVTVAGNVTDGWSASPASETGFELVRIQAVEKTFYGAPDFKESPPQVKLFFASTRSPKDATLVLRYGTGLFKKTIKLKIDVRPTPKC